MTALTKHNNNDLHELFQQEVLIRKMVLLHKTNLENLQGNKKKEEMPIICPAILPETLCWNPDLQIHKEVPLLLFSHLIVSDAL